MNLSALITEAEVDALVAAEADWSHFHGILDEYGDRFQMVGEGELPDHGTVRWHETMGDALLYAALQRWKGLYVTVLNDVAYDVAYATITRSEPGGRWVAGTCSNCGRAASLDVVMDEWSHDQGTCVADTEQSFVRSDG